MEQPKQSKGSVGLEVFRNRLRLRLPRSLFNGKQTYLSLEMNDTKLNRKIADQKIRQIKADILNNNFDFTLAKYKPQVHLAVVHNIKPKQEIKISELWEKYQAFKKPDCAPGTWRTYVLQERYLEKCPHKLIEEAQQIFDWIVLNIPTDSAKRLLVQLSACCNWAIANNFITTNPFEGLAKEIKLKNSAPRMTILILLAKRREMRLLRLLKIIPITNIMLTTCSFYFLQVLDLVK